MVLTHHFNSIYCVVRYREFRPVLGPGKTGNGRHRDNRKQGATQGLIYRTLEIGGAFRDYYPTGNQHYGSKAEDD